MAPAAALVTVGVTWTARCRGSTTPVTPAHSADAQQGAEVARVGDAVDCDSRNGGRLARAGGRQVVEVGLGQLGWRCAMTPWGASVRACGVELARGPPPRRRHAGLGGQLADVVEDRGRVEVRRRADLADASRRPASSSSRTA